MDDWDKILDNVELDETKEEYADEWFCSECEHGPMNEKDDKCTRCGEKNSQYHDGWNDEDIESEVEEIF